MVPELPTSGYYGPDGTAEPPPQPLFSDPLAGLVAGSVPSIGLDSRFDEDVSDSDVFDSDVVARPPAIDAPDAAALREAVEAVFAEEVTAAKPKQRRQPARRGTHQPGMIPQRRPRRGAPIGQRQSGGGGAEANRQRPAVRRPAGATRNHSAGLIIVVIFVIVVVFLVMRALFEWLDALFH